MPAKYYVTLTNYGAELVAAAHDLQSITLTQMVIGDANNVPYQPIDNTHLTQLVHQTTAIEIREVKIENSIATVSAIISANIGGFNIHEIGLTDASGKLVYIGNYHGAYKPVIDEGGGGELELVIDIKATAGAQALIEINPLIISADKAWVNKLLEGFIKFSDIVDNLTSGGRDSPLSAEQGKMLKSMVENFTNSFSSSNNYIKLPGGTILQWDRIYHEQQAQFFTFPIAFPNECFIINIGTGEHTVDVAEVLNIEKGSITRNGFKGWATAFFCHYTYIAIGR